MHERDAAGTTPRPWQIDEDGDISHDDVHIAHVTQAEEHPWLHDAGTDRTTIQVVCASNGRLIVEAVNRFDALRVQRDSLAFALELLEPVTRLYLDGSGDAAAVRAALATAAAVLLAHREAQADEH